MAFQVQFLDTKWATWELGITNEPKLNSPSICQCTLQHKITTKTAPWEFYFRNFEGFFSIVQVLPQRCPRIFDAFLTHFGTFLFPNRTRTHVGSFLTHFWRISEAFLLLPTPFPRTPFGQYRIMRPRHLPEEWLFKESRTPLEIMTWSIPGNTLREKTCITYSFIMDNPNSLGNFMLFVGQDQLEENYLTYSHIWVSQN